MCRETPPPPPPPRYLFLSGALLLRLVGESHNHSLFFPFSLREGWRDGARAAASASHATQLQPLTPPPSSLFLLLLLGTFSLSLSFSVPPSLSLSPVQATIHPWRCLHGALWCSGLQAGVRGPEGVVLWKAWAKMGVMVLELL